MTLDEKIVQSKKLIAKLEKRIVRLKKSDAYQNFWHRRHSTQFKKISYLEDELKIEKSLLYRLEVK